FAGPPDQSAAWSDAGAEGTHRFLRRLWSFAYFAQAPRAPARESFDQQAQLRFELHRLLGQISYDYERLQYNTVVSGAMKLLNLLETASRSSASRELTDEGLDILLRVLYPVAPHITQALWSALGRQARFGELVYAPWPQPDPVALQRQLLDLVVQVNGKLRGSIRVAVDATREAIEAAVTADQALAKFLVVPPKKFVIVPGKLVNVVL
ncbi:MAG TPA: class I tRNA ligase family protein, partial [Burkholderiaceae bacterium]|nr:class I tRNA ligase family protein [Burkholderiaceae bacterium]